MSWQSKINRRLRLISMSKRERRSETHSRHEVRALYSQYAMYNNNHVRMLQNLVLTKLGQMALILLTYKYSPTGCTDVNASIKPHSTLQSQVVPLSVLQPILSVISPWLVSAWVPVTVSVIVLPDIVWPVVVVWVMWPLVPYCFDFLDRWSISPC